MRVLATGYVYDLLRKLGLSTFGARTGEFLLVRPLKVVLVVVAAMVVSRLAARWLSRTVRSVQLRTLTGRSLRAEQRADTVAGVLSGLARIVVWAIAALIVFDQLGINLAPLLAGAGIAGLAIGFGAQALVKDFISGLFILTEDQYGVGDLVDLGDSVKGTVEELNLRVTRLRANDGTVWFVPNGEIRRVGNVSIEWAQATVDVLLPFDADIANVRRVIDDELARFSSEQRDGPVLDSPQVLGVESVTADGITVRVVVRTRPQQQLAVGRELRARVLARLRAEGVPLGPPARPDAR